MEPPFKRRRTLLEDSGEQNASPEIDMDGDPFCETLQRKATTVWDSGLVDEGFLQLKITMRWPTSEDTLRIMVETTENGGLIRFEVVFLGPCCKHMNTIGLTFFIGDIILLSLKGASIEMAPTSDTTVRTLPMIIKYSRGFCLKLVQVKQRPAVGPIINYLPASREKRMSMVTSIRDEPQPDDWFSTPAEGTANVAIQESSHGAQDITSEGTPATKTGDGLLSERTMSIAGDTAQNSRAASASSTQSCVGSTTENSRSGLSSRIQTPSAEPLGYNGITPTPILPTAEVQVLSKKLYRTTGPYYAQAQKNKQKTDVKPTEAPEQKITGNHTSQLKAASTKAAKKAAKKVAREERKKATEGLVKGSTVPIGDSDSTTTSEKQVEDSEQTEVPIVHTLSPFFSLSKQHNQLKSLTTQPKPREQPEPDNSKNPVASEPVSESSSSQNTRTNLLEGCPPAGMINYSLFNDLKSGSTRNIVGIVSSFPGPPTRTRSGEWSRKLLLVDASNYSALNPEQGFSVNCFAKTQQDSLPDVQKDDVVFLRGVKILEWNSTLTGVCASYKIWAWAIFNPATGSAKRSSESFKLSEGELQYAIRLGDWWREEQTNEAQPSTNVHQIGEGDVIFGSMRGTQPRQHRLFKDMTPNTHPNGFFDCTAEVLYGHANDNGVYSLYVTDYTHNDHMYTITSTWCSSTLADRVLKVEMWLEAALMGPEMKPGEFYYFGNIRMKTSTGGYVECTISEARKIRKLDEDALEEEPHLDELLRRKKEWEATAALMADRDGGHRFPHKVFSKVELETHFRCTAEVLWISFKDDRAYIYVTDYTPRGDLSPISAVAEWTQGIPHDRIVKIALLGGQAETAKSLSLGDYIAIRNLRLKSVGGIKDKNVTGRLGGDERLIIKLNPQGTGNVDLLFLLRRKAKRQKEIDSREYTALNPVGARGMGRPYVNKKPKKLALKGVSLPSGAVTIKQMLADPRCPGKFRLVARVVDFYPLELEDCVVLRCTNCNEDIPKSRRICSTCDVDLDESYVSPFYRFYFQIEDQEGTSIAISASNIESTLLKDLPPADLREDEEALEAFRTRLQPLLGNVLEQHERLILGEGLTTDNPDTPYLDLMLGSWPSEESNGDPGYILLSHVILENIGQS